MVGFDLGMFCCGKDTLQVSYKNMQNIKICSCERVLSLLWRILLYISKIISFIAINSFILFYNILSHIVTYSIKRSYAHDPVLIALYK